MAGHSKWANIKHRKARQDAKRAKVWTKVIREVTVAARIGGGNVEDNPRLRAAVDNALSVNMPRDTIDRAVKRGAGGEDGAEVEELTYEGYGPSGVAILVEAMTDTAIGLSQKSGTLLRNMEVILVPMARSRTYSPNRDY